MRREKGGKMKQDPGNMKKKENRDQEKLREDKQDPGKIKDTKIGTRKNAENINRIQER